MLPLAVFAALALALGYRGNLRSAYPGPMRDANSKLVPMVLRSETRDWRRVIVSF
jgi:hypothetical protein